MVATEPEPESAPERVSGPQRRCVASGTVCAKAELLRFVVDPSGTLVPDPGADLPGRGIWCLPRRDMIERAQRKGLFARAARRAAPGAATVPPDLADRAAVLLRRRCLDRLGLARRAGSLAAGAAKVRAALESGRAAVLVQARDGSPEERARLARRGRAVRPDLALVTLFDAAELGAAVGRPDVVHLAVTDGGAATGLLQGCRRLAGLLPAAAGGLDETEFDARRQRAPE